MNKPIPYNDVKIVKREGIHFGDPVFDKFISEHGGIVQGNMIALAGTSGAGKTTLCKKLQRDMPLDVESVFYALESRKGSVAGQTLRVKTGKNELICDEDTYPKWSQFMDYLYADKPALVIVDSLQHAAELLSEENGKHKYQNYKQIIKDLYTWKDKTQGIVILIVQLNAKGEVEGPEATVFDVDCPIKLIADPKTKERYIECNKNRMGGATGTPIFYEFTSDDRIISFMTEDEWRVRKQGVSLSEMISNTMENFLSAYVNHENYSDFRSEWMKAYNKVYNESKTDVEVTTKSIELLTSLSNKYFS